MKKRFNLQVVRVVPEKIVEKNPDLFLLWLVPLCFALAVAIPYLYWLFK